MLKCLKRVAMLAWPVCAMLVMSAAPSICQAVDMPAGGIVPSSAAAINGSKVQPLPLPADPSTACSKKVFNDFCLLYRSCTSKMYHRKNPDKLCCQGLSEWFGLNSTRPSRNCFCVPEVMKPLVDYHDYHDIHFEENFQYCGIKYGLVIPFYQGGNGYCNGTQDDPVDITAVDIEYTKIDSTPTFSEWASRLDKDWLMLTSFITGVISVPGFFIFLWPFAYEFGFAVVEMANRNRAKMP